MTQSKELKQVSDALDKLEDANYGVPTTSEDSLHRDLAIANAVYEIRATLDRLSAPVGVPVSMTLGDLEFLAEIKTAFEYLNTKPDADPERLWAVGKIFDAARAYLELQNAVPTPNPSIPPQHGVLMPEGYIKAIGAPTPATKLQKDVNLVDGVNDCKFETHAPTACDLDGLKRDVSKKIIFARPDEDDDDYRLHGIICACIDHLLSKYEFVRKV